MTTASEVQTRSFWQNPLVGSSAGALAALLMAGLSAFALKRLDQEMNWIGVLSGGAAGGLAGHVVLRGVLLWLDRQGDRKSSMDRFAWIILSGLATSLVLGVLFFTVVFVSLPAAGESGARGLGPRLFVVIGWLVGILASSLPLAIVELQRADNFPGGSSSP